MFSAIRQNAPFYILDKSNGLNLKTGQVLTVSNVMPKYKTSLQFNSQFPEQVVDISVKVNDEVLKFEQIPANLSIVDFGSNNLIISESAEAISVEIENSIKQSTSIIESVPIHQQVITDGEELLKKLNPKFAKEKEQADKMNSLENKITTIESSISDMRTMLSEVLSLKTN